MTEYLDKKKLLQKDNTNVRRPIERLDRQVLKSTGRRKKTTPRRMMNGINRYFEWCEKNDEVPSIKGMMIHLKMMRDQFYTYLKYPEFTEILEHARMIIANWAEMDVYSTKGMAAGKIAYMKNVHGWADKLDQKQEVTHKEMTPEEARQRIEQLAPKLLESLKSSEVVKQLVKDDAIEAEVVDESGNNKSSNYQG